MEFVEKITWLGRPLAYIIKRELTPSATSFLTPADFTQQVGFVVYPAGGEVKPHLHRPLERTIRGKPWRHGSFGQATFYCWSREAMASVCWKTLSLSKSSKVLTRASTKKSGSEIGRKTGAAVAVRRFTNIPLNP